MQINSSAVIAIVLLAVFGYGIPAYLLLRRADVSRTGAALLTILLLIPAINCAVLYFLAWVFRRRREQPPRVVAAIRLART